MIHSKLQERTFNIKFQVYYVILALNHLEGGDDRLGLRSTMANSCQYMLWDLIVYS